MSLLDVFKNTKELRKHEYTLEFEKLYHPSTFISGKSVQSGWLLRLMYELKYKYDFDIIKANICEPYNISEIKIKCYKEDKGKIFTEFCISAQNEIENINF